MKYELRYNSKQTNIVFLLVLFSLIIEVSLDKLSSDIPNIVNSQIGVLVFNLVALVSLLGFYYLYKLSSRDNTLYINSNNLPSIPKNTKVMDIIVYLLLGLNILIISEVFFSFYNIILLNILFLFSYGVSISLFIIVSFKFLKWFKIKKNVLFLLYGLSMVFIACSIFAFSFYVEPRILDKMLMADPFNPFASKIEINTGLDIRSNFSSPHISNQITFSDNKLDQTSFIIHIIGFMKKTINDHSIDIYIFLLWIATIVLLAHNRKKMGNLKFMIIVCLPIIYYVFSYDLFSSLNPKTGLGTIPDLIYDGLNNACDDCPPDLVAVILSTLVEAYAVFIIGLFIYLGLNALSKTIQYEHILKKCLTLGSFGFLLFFINSEASVANTAFPPYGIFNTSFLVLSTYLFINGISISAYIIANDHQLRREVKKSTINTVKFINEMGEAEDMMNIEKKVKMSLKNQNKLLIEEKYYSITPNEISDYIQEIIKEIHDKNKDG